MNVGLFLLKTEIKTEVSHSTLPNENASGHTSEASLKPYYTESSRKSKRLKQSIMTHAIPVPVSLKT